MSSKPEGGGLRVREERIGGMVGGWMGWSWEFGIIAGLYGGMVDSVVGRLGRRLLLGLCKAEEELTVVPENL